MKSKMESNFEKFSTKASANQKAGSRNKIENSPDHYNKCCGNIITEKIKTNLTRQNKLSFNAWEFVTYTGAILQHITLNDFIEIEKPGNTEPWYRGHPINLFIARGFHYRVFSHFGWSPLASEGWTLDMEYVSQKNWPRSGQVRMYSIHCTISM